VPKKSTSNADQESFLEPRARTAPVVPKMRQLVRAWRSNGYKGCTATTKQLLNHWFMTDHRQASGLPFRYHDSQREAIETLIYVFEIAQIRRHKDLLEAYAPNLPGIHVLQYDNFARYAIKMATGSGKTKVMSLAIAWQFLNAAIEEKPDYARNFLVLAPNVIVFERLRTDFGGGHIFRADPVIPASFKIFWDFDCYIRGQVERSTSHGALYLTNIQQFYEREEPEDDEPEPMTAVLGLKPQSKTIEPIDFDQRIAARSGRCMVLNDEGHHTHDEESEWNKIIRSLDALTGGLAGQLDFSATPRYAKGGLFTWTIYDYPLKQAILDGVVKRPMKGVASGIKELPSDVAHARYRAYLTAGVERWREYRDQLAPLKKKPILFIMMSNTSDADDVGEYLQVKYPSEFGGSNLLVIHTDNTGQVAKKDLDKARTLARQVDDEENPVNAIVSVLMLREGWDVQNVTVVVGLRPFTATANILPEQAIGRGLRLMFRSLSSDYIERVDVIGNKAFLQFIDQLEKDEDLALETFNLKDPLIIQTIAPDPNKLDVDIAIPVLSPILARKKTLAEEIAALDVNGMVSPILPRTAKDTAAQQFHYEGYDIVTLQKMVERDYTIPEAQTSQEVISYYAKRIAQDLKLPAQFAALAPKVREFLQSRAFGQAVDLDDPQMVKAISSSVAQYVTVQTFAKALRGLVVQELAPQLIDEGKHLSETPPFPFSKQTFDARKTVYTRVASDNDLEREFARFLQEAPDVAAFAKLPSQFGFAIEYTDTATNLRYYEPDFVVKATTGTHYLIETKGREDIDVVHKDRAARIWCENATLLTNAAWGYLKVPQAVFMKLQPSELNELLIALPQEGTLL
jgi:type III restriction enzyme